MTVFHRVTGVPVHSVRLIRTREAALAAPRGDIELGFCGACGFTANLAYDPHLSDYSQGYEPTQAFSPAFNRFHKDLAARLIERHGLRNKTIIEIGCGQGEFLALLCAMGDNRGTGFDPAYVDRGDGPADGRMTVVPEVFSEAHPQAQADFYACKMTLEHIREADEFVAMVRRAVGGRRDAVVFFQVPDATRILREIAFWDIYYEHVSYFAPRSLAALLERCGFEVLDVGAGFDGQYLMIEARPGAGDGAARHGGDPSTLAGDVERFRAEYPAIAGRWRGYLRAMQGDGLRVVLWGGGSKAVAFLTALGLGDEIACAVDINPRKAGTYLAGTGHPVVAPESLSAAAPDVVIVMNPVYTGEIRDELRRLGLSPRLVPLDPDTPGGLAPEHMIVSP